MMVLCSLGKYRQLSLRSSRSYRAGLSGPCIRQLTAFIRPNVKIDQRQGTQKTRRSATMEALQDIGWIKTKYFSVFPWSVSGVESCVVAKNSQLSVAFDMGYAFPDAVRSQHVMISHGHVDHVSGILQHAAKRSLYSMPTASYYVPPHIMDPLQRMGNIMSEIHDPTAGDIAPLKLVSINPGDTLDLAPNWFARPFPTVHRVTSQGYIVYQRQKSLKPEFQGLPGQEIGKLVKDGHIVNNVINEPTIAYTGDTTFELFLNPPTKDLLNIDTLITEATYIDGDTDARGVSSVQKAHERGHCHLRQFIEHQHLFKNVNNLILLHFSDKYSTKFIKKIFEETVPDSLKSKIHLGIQLKTLSEIIQSQKD